MEKLDSSDPAHPLPGAGPVAGTSVTNAAGDEGDEALTGIGSKLFQCACMRRLLPTLYREELYHVLRLSGPLLVSRVLMFLMPLVISIFCGHIGKTELAGYALASAIINVTTISTGYGLALACDTLISQTFGGKNLKRVGLILQKSSLILLIYCLPCWAILINSYNLLRLLHQEDAVARIAHLYTMCYLPAVPAMVFFNLQVSYLQNQGIILPQMYTAAAANVINLGVNYVLIVSLQLGVVGSAIANALSQITICLLLFGYIRWRKLHKETWGGWSTECLQDWGSYMKLAVPSLFMTIFEWWIWEIGGFLAGVIGEDDLAAQHVMVEVGAITYMFPLGIHAAACVRVGNALGAGNANRALATCKVAISLSASQAVLQGIVLASCKSVVGYIFTSDDGIVEIVSNTITVYVFLQFFDGLLCIFSGILIGAGMQKIAALANLVSYYFIGLPIGIALMFAAKLRILGLWLGLFICGVLQVGFFFILILKLDWNKVSKKAQQRAGKKVAVTPKRPNSIMLNEGMVPDLSECPNTAQINGEEATKADGYTPVHTQDQEAESNNTKAEVTEKDVEENKNKSTSKPPVIHSMPQLILRRGLIFLISALILAVGVALHFWFPIPEPVARSEANFTLNWANVSTPTPLTPLDVVPNL